MAKFSAKASKPLYNRHWGLFPLKGEENLGLIKGLRPYLGRRALGSSSRRPRRPKLYQTYAMSRQCPEFLFTIVFPTMSHFWKGDFYHLYAYYALHIFMMVPIGGWGVFYMSKGLNTTCHWAPLQVYNSTSELFWSSSRQWPNNHYLSW